VAATSAMALSAAAGSAWAAPEPVAAKDDVVQEVIVTGAANLTGVLQQRDSSVAFGIDKPIVETPRSVTAISDLLLDRYNIKSVYDFTAVAAGTYTGSYFGVPGSINIRGSIADNYFNGFKQITNFANYPTPVQASSRIDLVRGPPSPVYGAGHIGGYMNFVPKSARGENTKYLTEPTGAASVTVGSYNQKEATIEGGAPVSLGGHASGLYGYLQLQDSDSFYYRVHPKSIVGQLTFSTDLNDAWSFSTTAQYIYSDGYLKDIGWNRVTQDLIDNGNYVSGKPLAQIVAPGASFITDAAFAAASRASGSGIQQYVLPGFGVRGRANPYTTLDPATVRTVKLSPRETAASDLDINRVHTPQIYMGLTRQIGDGGSLKFESFTQYLDALNYQSYGFATLFRTTLNEERVTYSDKREFFDGKLATQTVGGAGYRWVHAQSSTYLNSGVNIQDRWDLSLPQTPDEIFNAVYGSSDHGGRRWDNDIRSRHSDLSAFVLEDLLFMDALNITGGLRYDRYKLSAIDTGPFASAAFANTWVKMSAHPISYSISVSLKNPYAIPYFTYAKTRSLNEDQANAVNPSLIYGRSAIGTSELNEVGLKTSQLNGRLYAAIDGYRQRNQFFNFRTGGVDTQLARGVETELRYLVTHRLGITGTATFQRVRQLANLAGSGPFLVITPQQAGLTGEQGWGGMFDTNAAFVGMGNGYELHTSPHFTGSLFATYDVKGKWGLTGGVTYNTWTGGSIPGSIRLPAYALAKGGAYVMFGNVRADLYVDNLFDKRYFMAEYDVDSNVAVLPGVGRQFHFKLSTKF
jgi:iron complex outermembrane receptor protein